MGERNVVKERDAVVKSAVKSAMKSAVKDRDIDRDVDRDTAKTAAKSEVKSEVKTAAKRSAETSSATASSSSSATASSSSNPLSSSSSNPLSSSSNPLPSPSWNTLANTAEKQTPNSYFEPRKKSSTLILDNGTFELKAGYPGDLCMIVKNRIYKSKEKVSLEPFPAATIKTMFDRDVIVSFDVLEQTIDLVLDHLKPTSLKNLIFTTTVSSPTEPELINFLFETYKFEKIQIGYDFIYLYHKYFDKEDCVIIDFKYSSIIVCVVKDKAIYDTYKINFGGKAMLDYISYCMIDKYKECRKDYRGLVEHLRVSENYNMEALEIYHEMCNGIYDRNIFLTDPVVHRAEPVVKKVKKVEKPAGIIPSLDYALLAAPDETLAKDQLKEKRRIKMVFCGTLARLKTKIDRLLTDLSSTIASIEDELEKQTNLKKYIQKKKAKFHGLKRELEVREQIRRETRNKKSREFAVKFKEGQLTEDEQTIKTRILDAEDEEQENSLIASLERLAQEISELDPEFIPFYANTVEILRGDNLGRQCVNIELIKWPEIMFDPSIIGSEHMGLTEVFENIFPETQIENVLISGGFSFIKNLERRISEEVKSHLKSGRVNVKRVEDGQREPFMSCGFSDLFRVYTRDDKKM